MAQLQTQNHIKITEITEINFFSSFFLNVKIIFLNIYFFGEKDIPGPSYLSWTS